jgi:hypothetical protein
VNRPLRDRRRPATYPPKAKLRRDAKRRYTPERIASATEASRHVGADEAVPNPNAVPKAKKIKNRAAAITAPAKIGLQPKNGDIGPAVEEDEFSMT